MKNQPSQAQQKPPQSAKPAKKENMLLNIAFNILIPTLILTKLSGDDYLGVKVAILVALAFPVIYGLRDFIGTRKVNFFSALGVISVLLTGGISLLELDAQYLAIKEAMIPALLGIGTVISLKTRYPLVKTFLYNEAVLDTNKIATALHQKNNTEAFDRCLINASWLVALSFFISAALNYILATWLVTADPGTVEFNEQLGKMTALSFPVIAVPATLVLLGALYYLFRGIKKLTGLSFEEVLPQHQK